MNQVSRYRPPLVLLHRLLAFLIIGALFFGAVATVLLGSQLYSRRREVLTATATTRPRNASGVQLTARG